MLRFLYRLFLVVSLSAAVAVVAFRIMASNRETQSVSDLLLPESRMVETVHGRMHVLEDGPENGTPVLLIHGSVGWAGLWRETSDYLVDQGYRVIALDLPPMGLSERVTGLDYSRQAQGLRILAVAETLATPPILVAHSFGAGGAFEAMMAGAEAFRGSIIIAGALSLGQDGTGQDVPMLLRPPVVREAALAATVTNPYATKTLFRQFVHRKEGITDDIAETLEYPFVRKGTTEALAEWLPTLLLPPQNAASTDPDRYRAVDLPIMLIWGREDTVTPPEQAEALSTALGTAPIFWMENIGHIPQVEDPQSFNPILAEALARIDQG